MHIINYWQSYDAILIVRVITTTTQLSHNQMLWSYDECRCKHNKHVLPSVQITCSGSYRTITTTTTTVAAAIKAAVWLPSCYGAHTHPCLHISKASMYSHVESKFKLKIDSHFLWKGNKFMIQYFIEAHIMLSLFMKPCCSSSLARAEPDSKQQ